jgi:ferritin-like metal-binding protein YciE
MTLTTMHHLLVHELQDLYGAEQQLIAAMPALISAATEPLLADEFRSHSAQAELHVTRLEECFRALGEEPKAIKCKGMEGLLKEAAEMAAQEGNPLVRDAGLIGSAQRIEHYEIAAYGTCLELAKVMGNKAVTDLLHETLEEEHKENVQLTYIAKTDVNPKAILSAV